VIYTIGLPPPVLVYYKRPCYISFVANSQNALNQLDLQQAALNGETKKPNIVGLRTVPKEPQHPLSSLVDEGIKYK
jgi:hypothetical protein